MNMAIELVKNVLAAGLPILFMAGILVAIYKLAQRQVIFGKAKENRIIVVRRMSKVVRYYGWCKGFTVNKKNGEVTALPSPHEDDMSMSWLNKMGFFFVGPLPYFWNVYEYELEKLEYVTDEKDKTTKKLRPVKHLADTLMVKDQCGAIFEDIEIQGNFKVTLEATLNFRITNAHTALFDNRDWRDQAIKILTDKIRSEMKGMRYSPDVAKGKDGDDKVEYTGPYAVSVNIIDLLSIKPGDGQTASNVNGDGVEYTLTVSEQLDNECGVLLYSCSVTQVMLSGDEDGKMARALVAQKIAIEEAGAKVAEADGEAKSILKIGEAEANAIRAKLNAQADGRRAMLEAEAIGVKSVLSAEASGAAEFKDKTGASGDMFLYSRALERTKMQVYGTDRINPMVQARERTEEDKVMSETAEPVQNQTTNKTSKKTKEAS